MVFIIIYLEQFDRCVEMHDEQGADNGVYNHLPGAV